MNPKLTKTDMPLELLERIKEADERGAPTTVDRLIKTLFKAPTQALNAAYRELVDSGDGERAGVIRSILAGKAAAAARAAPVAARIRATRPATASKPVTRFIHPIA